MVTLASGMDDCLDNLVEQFPQLKDLLFDKKGKLFKDFSVYVNGGNISPQNLGKRVSDGDKIHIVDIILGG